MCWGFTPTVLGGFIFHTPPANTLIIDARCYLLARRGKVSVSPCELVLQSGFLRIHGKCHRVCQTMTPLVLHPTSFSLILTPYFCSLMLTDAQRGAPGEWAQPFRPALRAHWRVIARQEGRIDQGPHGGGGPSRGRGGYEPANARPAHRCL